VRQKGGIGSIPFLLLLLSVLLVVPMKRDDIALLLN
jgi:hypothetical protein